jgi:hypothetical protein
MENKQTPIDYIKDNLFYPIQINQLKRVLNEAEQMHKEQITDAFLASTIQFANDARMDYPKLPEQYYNETYGNHEKN